MVRNAIYTIYMGKEYIVYRGNTKNETYFRIRSNNKDDLNLGFRVSDNGIVNCFVKDITPSEVGEVYSIDTYGIYKNYKFSLSEHGELYALWTSDCEIAEKLGFEMLGRGDYEKLVPKSDIEHIYEVKEIIPDYFD